MHKFSDFSKEEHSLSGTKVKINEIIKKEIEILAYRIMKSQYQNNSELKTYVQLQFKMQGDDEIKCIFTGSLILANQLKKYQNEIPFSTIIEHHGKYYTFT